MRALSMQSPTLVSIIAGCLTNAIILYIVVRTTACAHTETAARRIKPLLNMLAGKATTFLHSESKTVKGWKPFHPPYSIITNHQLV